MLLFCRSVLDALLLAIQFGLVHGLRASHFGAGTCVGNISELEYNFLQDFYNATNGPNWRFLPRSGIRWVFPSPLSTPCRGSGRTAWVGILCSPIVNASNQIPCTISSLGLSGFALEGTIPGSIGVLTNLEMLDLSSNSLSRSLPPQLGLLRNLESLILRTNFLTGSIPPEFGALASLQYFSLNTNSLSGPIPSSLGNLLNLEYLYLSFNFLDGSIPPELGRLVKLEYMILYINFLDGPIPSQLGLLTSLAFMDLNTNLLSGPIPPELGGLVNLQCLFLDINFLFGRMPSELGLLTNLEFLDLDTNHLTGPVTLQLGRMQSLQFAYLSNNALSGHIPPELGQLSNVINLIINNNSFSGPIPSQIIGCRNLVFLEIDANSLSGPVPSQLGELRNLLELDLQGNFLTGPIPPELSNLTNLQYLFMYRNHLTSSIPAELNLLANLQYLRIFENFFTGSIPPELSSLSALQNLDLSHNSLTGPVPSALGNLSSLEYLYLSTNSFRGPVPPQLGLLGGLIFLQLDANSLTGTIPSDIGDLRSLLELNLQENRLTGAVPRELGNLTHLQYLALNTNSLSGSIPTAWSTLADLRCLFLFANCLTGSIPAELDMLADLEFLDLDSNYLTGRVPPELGYIENLEYICLFANHLTGSLPTQLSLLSALAALILNDNKFTGPIGRIFSNNTQVALEIIDLSNNGFTGSVSSRVWSLPGLKTLILASNCFSGTLGPDLCYGTNMTTLDLDSASGGDSECQRPILPGLKPFSSLRPLNGIVPDCVWHLESLQVLHLAGNDFSGTLPSSIPINLTDLAISHNRFSGTFPMAFQSKEWATLDISFNRIGGTISSSIPSLMNGATISMQNNWLSGSVPGTWRDSTTATLNVLQGNLFNCPYGHQSLPQSDPDEESYQCGSNIFNLAMLCWLLLLGIAVGCVTISAVVHSQKNTAESRSCRSQCLSGMALIAQFKTAPSNSGESQCNDRLLQFWRDMRMWQFVVAVTSILACGVCLPLYIYFTQCCAIFTVQDSWRFSAAYLSGTAPGVGLLGIALVTFFGIVIVRLWLNKQHVTDSAPSSTSRGIKSPIRWSEVVGITAIMSFNFVVVTAIDGSFVYLSERYSNGIVATSQVFLAAFKYLWFDVVICKLYALLLIPGRDEASTHRSEQDTDFSSTKLAVVICNSFIIPFLSVAAVDADCFYYAFASSPNVATSYTYEFCQSTTIFSPLCSEHFTSVVVSEEFTPQFAYSYQCSSSFISSYSNVYIIFFAIAAFVEPGIFFLRKAIATGLFAESASLAAAAAHDSTLSHQMQHDEIEVEEEKDDAKAASSRSWLTEVIVRWIDPSPALYDKSNRCMPILKDDKLSMRILAFFGILVTFGVCVPLIAVTIVVAFGAQTYLAFMQVDMCIRRLEEKHDFSAVEDVKEACGSQFDRKGLGIALILFYTSWLYALLVFDTIGSAVGAVNAVRASVLICAVPIVTELGLQAAWCVRWLLQRWRGARAMGVRPEEDMKKPLAQSSLRDTVVLVPEP